jgi:hypothetical protein
MKPGEEIINQGIADLTKGIETIPSLLVSIGAPRLQRLGVTIPPTTIASPEHRLYEALRHLNPDSAHSQYNALIRWLVSFERAAEREASWTSKNGFTGIPL